MRTTNKMGLILACFLGLGLNVGLADARPLTTGISTDNDPLKDDPIRVVTAITMGKGNFFTDVLGKALNLPKTVKISDVGFLANALSMEAIQATSADPKSYTQTTVLPYLKNSKEMSDSLKLRRTARQIKFQALSTLMKKAGGLNDEQKKGILNFLSQQIGAPLIVLEKSPLPSFLPEPGPCMIPIGIEVVEPKTNARLALETSAICILDITVEGQKLFSVKESLDNDTLDIVLCHENGHGIMVDMYGKVFGEIQRISTNGHDSPYITDLGLAYIEGWAEAFEAVYGPANPKLKEKDRKKYNISEFLFGRQDPIRRDRYIWARFHGKKTGVMKNGLQLASTEGVVAGQFYDILTSRAITGAFEKAVTVMLLQHPQNYPDFIRGFAKMFPDDRKVLYRIVLEGLNYVTMDNQAGRLYYDYYQAKLAFVQKKGTSEALETAKKAFVNFKEELFKKAMNGADIFANVGPQMWFSGFFKVDQKHGLLDWKYKLAKKMGKDPDLMPFNLDLNTVTAKMLVGIGLAAEEAEKVILARNTRGFFTGDPLQSLASVCGKDAFTALKEKGKLQNYQPKENAKPDNQAKAYWPEDLEKIAVSE